MYHTKTELSNRRSNISFDKSRPLESYKALKTLDKEHYVPIINIFAYRYYLSFLIYLVKVEIEVTQVDLI